MSEHTPGPWRANSSWIEGPKMALRVACVDWPRRGCAPCTKNEAEANARLIAAAPDLLKAMKRLDRLYKGICMMVPDDEMAACQEVWAEADAAIAKAEGRS